MRCHTALLCGAVLTFAAATAASADHECVALTGPNGTSHLLHMPCTDQPGHNCDAATIHTGAGPVGYVVCLETQGNPPPIGP